MPPKTELVLQYILGPGGGGPKVGEVTRLVVFEK